MLWTKELLLKNYLFSIEYAFCLFSSRGLPDAACAMHTHLAARLLQVY